MITRKSLSEYDAIVFFDTETTGLNPQTCRIIELAALRVEIVDGKFKLVKKMDRFIKLPVGGYIPAEVIN